VVLNLDYFVLIISNHCCSVSKYTVFKWKKMFAFFGFVNLELVNVNLSMSGTLCRKMWSMPAQWMPPGTFRQTLCAETFHVWSLKTISDQSKGRWPREDWRWWWWWWWWWMMIVAASDKSGSSASLLNGSLLTYVTIVLTSLLTVAIVVICYYRQRMRTITGARIMWCKMTVFYNTVEA